jgi:two-component system phosphate regulon sensor histidine kinase PhoR
VEFWFGLGWFLVGFAVGAGFLVWYHLQLTQRLRRLIQNLNWEESPWTLIAVSKLTRSIAARLDLQRELEQQLETWQFLFQEAPIGVLQVDEENQLLWCNPRSCQLLSIQPGQQVRPRLLLELVRSYELDELIEHTRTARRPSTRDWTFHPVSADQPTLSQQQSRRLRGYGVPLPDGCVGVFLESRQEAVLLAQQRDRWTSDVAHELKTPLTSIRLVAETLQSRLDPPLVDWVDRLLDETIRLSSLVQDLLDLSQLEAQPGPRLNLKVIDLSKLVQSAWASLEPLARRKHLHLNYVGPDSVLIQADELRLHRVLINLLDNSIRYSPTHSAIQVQVGVNQPQTASEQVSLEVIDAGCGFPENAIPHVFERFYRADPSRSRGRDAELKALNLTPRRSPDSAVAAELEHSASGGSGLGLAIVRQIVEAHQGTVGAQNHPETHGAWIQILLPTHQTSAGKD